MKKRYSLLVAALLLGSTNLAAEESLEEAFKKGETSGYMSWYAQEADFNNANKNGFSHANASIHYETGSFYGFSLGMGAWGSAKTSEKNDGDFEGAIADKSVIHQAYIKYTLGDELTIIAGRQEVDFEWMSDFIEGATVQLGYVEDLVLTMAWAKKQAVVGVDEISTFSNLNDDNGIYMLDAKYTLLEWLELNPYYYHAQDILNAWGMKATASFDMSDDVKTATMLGYTQANSDVVGVEDGYVARVEQGVEAWGIKAALGYIRVDKDGAAGLGAFGDQMPLEEGNFVLDANAKTVYVSGEYEIEGVTLGAIYGQTRYFDGAANVKEKELSVSAGYEVYQHLEASLVYVNVNNDDNANSYNAVKVLVEYTF